MKKRTWYLTLLTIITVICIAIGLLVHVVLPAGNWLSDMSDDLDDVNDSESFLSGSTVYEEVAAFSNIHLEMEVSDISIAYGDTYAISYKTNKENLLPQYEVKNETLYISQKTKKVHGLTNNADCTCKITVPKDAVLKLIDGTINVGDFTMERLGTDTLNISSSVGDIDISDNLFTTITLQSDVGDISLENVTFQAAALSSDVGDIDVETPSPLDSYKMDLSCDIGEIEINDRSFRSHYKQDAAAANAQTLTVTSDTGDISIEY